MQDAQEPAQHRCTICLTAPPQQAAAAQCGHEFCLECLQQWCRTRREPKCPLCWTTIQSITHGGAQQARQERRSEQPEVPPPDKLEEEGPDLGCLDHRYFHQESDRLLCRARQAQMHIVRAAYGCGRQGSGAADDAADTLQQVIHTLEEYRDDMQREVPFQPETVLHELYSLEQIVSSIAAGGWAAGGGSEAAPAARFSADDAAAGFHDFQDNSDDDSQEGWSEDDEGLDSRTRQRLERASFSSTPGRRPVPGGGGGGGSARRRSGGGGSTLAGSRSSGSLTGGGGGGRRR